RPRVPPAVWRVLGAGSAAREARRRRTRVLQRGRARTAGLKALHDDSDGRRRTFRSAFKDMVDIPDLAALRDRLGQEIAVSDWIAITQQRIDRFAEATDDRQWIHVDPARAAFE